MVAYAVAGGPEAAFPTVVVVGGVGPVQLNSPLSPGVSWPS